MRVAFIGVGNMGEAMLSALLRRKLIRPNAIRACDIDDARLAYIEKKYKVNCTKDIKEAIDDCEVIVMAVKPQVIPKAMKDMKGALKEEQLVLSIAAGTGIASIRKGLGHDAIVRVMPNTPAQVGEGMSVWAATNAVSKRQKDMAQTTLRAMGRELNVPDEKYIDMATAISGSGPAYIFLIMEALTDAAVHIGLPRDIAGDLVSQTILGSAHMTRETGKHPAELKNMVTSPGGTTAEGLLCLEEGGIRAIIAQAVIAAYEKAKQLGDKNE